MSSISLNMNICILVSVEEVDVYCVDGVFLVYSFDHLIDQGDCIHCNCLYVS